MSAGLTTLFGAIGAVAAILAVLVPIIRSQGASLRREIDYVRADLHDLRVRVDALSDRVARIEGALTGPWRAPTNGPSTPAPATESSPQTTA